MCGLSNKKTRSGRAKRKKNYNNNNNTNKEWISILEKLKGIVFVCAIVGGFYFIFYFNLDLDLVLVCLTQKKK